MSTKIYGGVNIAMKVPPHQYEATIAFYRDVVGLKPIENKAPAIGFELGSNQLWIDEAPGMSQAEVWLELYSDDFPTAAAHLAKAGAIQCNAIEPLPEGFRGGWFINPANIVHMVREPNTW
jgi:catechol 2,3-dioxygenase-like lactoylglutathione lyase family enzyme